MKTEGLTWWFKHNCADGNFPDGIDAAPYHATARQEERYRRLVALLDECEEEIEGLKRQDPRGESDQVGCLKDERAELEHFAFNHAGTLGLNSYPRHLTRVLKGRAQKARNLQRRTVRRMKATDAAYDRMMQERGERG